ncbi:MAG: molybdopterin-dependent oxidoreductase, partial [Pseudomonadota bacterium]
MFDPDFANSRCAVIWGIDIESSYRPNYYRPIEEARKKGAKLIVVDPRKTSLAEKADIWMQVRPGTDCALALGMINV